MSRTKLYLEAAKQVDWGAIRIYWVRHNEFHWAVKFKDFNLSYWPSTGKWQWNNPVDCKMYHGMPQDLVNWIKERQAWAGKLELKP